MIFAILVAKNQFMLIEDEFKAIYLNDKIKEIILFLEKLNPKEKEKIIVILKKSLKKDWDHNTVSMLATLACSNNKSEYKTIASSCFSFPVNGKKYAEKRLNKENLKNFDTSLIPEFYKNKCDSRNLNADFNSKYRTKKIHTVTISNQSPLRENVGLLNCVFNSYHDVYCDDLVQIPYIVPYFSTAFFAEKDNKTLPNGVYQYGCKRYIKFFNTWVNLQLPFQKIHYLFLSTGLFSKDKAFSDTAFEALVNRAVVANFDLSVVRLLIVEKINSGLAQVKKITDGFSACINLSPEYNQAFEKLIISILTAIKNPVFNLKKLLELYYELMKLNHFAPNEALIEN